MKSINIKNIIKTLKKTPVEVLTILLVLVVAGYTVAPLQARANASLFDYGALNLEIKAMQNEFASYGTLPTSDVRGPSSTMTVPATAYNSLPWQTDDTPFTTASGTQTRHGVIAANFLPIGTRVKMPELCNDNPFLCEAYPELHDKVFIVEDRMNARYWYKVDIWLEGYDEAIQFGAQNVEIEIYEGA